MPAPGQATEEISIAKAEITIVTKMDNMMKAFEAWTFQLTKVNEPRYRGYQTARVYAVQADHPPSHTPINFTPPNAPTGPPYYWLGPNDLQYPWQGLGPCINCDELGHICTYYPDVRTAQEKGIVHLNDRGGLTLVPRGGNGCEISGYRPERRLLSMWESAREVARQRQQGGRVATTAAPQPPQPQHIARSQLFQMSIVQVTMFRWRITRQLLEFDRYYSGRFTRKEGKEEGNDDRMEELSDGDVAEEPGQGDSSAEEEEGSEMEEETDACLDEEEKEKRSTVMRKHAGYAFVDERWMRTKEVTTGDDRCACIEEEVLEVLTSTSKQENWTIRKAVAFNKQPAKTDPIENTTPKTPKTPNGLQKKAPALDTRNYKVLESCQLDYTIQARQ